MSSLVSESMCEVVHLFCVEGGFIAENCSCTPFKAVCAGVETNRLLHLDQILVDFCLFSRRECHWVGLTLDEIGNCGANSRGGRTNQVEDSCRCHFDGLRRSLCRTRVADRRRENTILCVK